MIKADLQAEYLEVKSIEAPASWTKEKLIESLLSEDDEDKATKKGKTSFGNQDKEKKYDLSGLNIPADSVVVRHFSTISLMDGTPFEDPSTNRFQVYDQKTWQDLTTQRTDRNGKQMKSKLEEISATYQVLHK